MTMTNRRSRPFSFVGDDEEWVAPFAAVLGALHSSLQPTVYLTTGTAHEHGPEIRGRRRSITPLFLVSPRSCGMGGPLSRALTATTALLKRQSSRAAAHHDSGSMGVERTGCWCRLPQQPTPMSPSSPWGWVREAGRSANRDGPAKAR
jgi:hypothetical protein